MRKFNSVEKVQLQEKVLLSAEGNQGVWLQQFNCRRKFNSMGKFNCRRKFDCRRKLMM